MRLGFGLGLNTPRFRSGGVEALPVLPADNPRMAIIGPSTAWRNASAQNNSPNNYGPSAVGPYMWAQRLGLKFDHRLQWRNTSPFVQGDNFGAEGAGFPEIEAQCTAVVSAFTSITNKWVSVAPGRNEIQNQTITTVEAYMIRVRTCVERLIAGGFTQGTNRILLEGIWKKPTAYGGVWAANGAARALVDPINAAMAAYAGSLDNVVFLDMQTGMAIPGDANGNPPSGTTVSDNTHYAQFGAMRAGRIIRDALAPLLVPYTFPTRPAENVMPAFGAGGGTLANGATGQVVGGWEVAREASGNVSAVVASIVGGRQRIDVTTTAGVNAGSEAAHFRLASNGAVAHGRPANTLLGMRARVLIPATGVPFGLAFRVTDLGSNGKQGMGISLPYSTGASSMITQAAAVAAGNLPVLWADGSEDLDLWLETALIPLVTGSQLRPLLALRYGPLAGGTIRMDIVDIHTFTQS